MRLVKVTIGDRPFWVRPNTSDIKAIEESYLKGYERKGFYSESDVWIDAGANAGGFSVKAAGRAKRVIAFEPDRQNYLVLKQNTKDLPNVEIREQGLGYYSRNTLLHRNTKNGNVWRNSILKEWQGGESEVVSIVSLDEVIRETGATALKLDVEGAEFEILERCELPGIVKMVFEYSFDIDASLERYRAILERVESLGFDIANKKTYPDHKVWPKTWFPPCQTIWATKMT